MKKKLLLGLMVLTLAVLILPTGPAGALGDGAGEGVTSEPTSSAGAPGDAAGEPQSTEEVSNPSSTEGVVEGGTLEFYRIPFGPHPDSAGAPGDGAGEGGTPEFHGIPFLGPRETRDAEIAAKYGIPGYVEFSLLDGPQKLALSRGEEWSGTMLVHFVSYTPELTELQLYVDPQHGVGLLDKLLNGGGYYAGRSYEGGFIDFSNLISYSPSGAMVIRAGETLPIEMTVRIPADFPESIERVPLGAMGIWSDTRGIGFIDSIATSVIVR